MKYHDSRGRYRVRQAALISDKFLAALDAAGFAVVPKETTCAMLDARDDDNDWIWAGGTEHYFRNDEEAHWFGRQVWRSMINAGKIR